MKEWMKYACNGVLTTGINYCIYITLNELSLPYLLANTMAWLGAVLFAYYTNRKWVFRSVEKIKKEFIHFFSLRFITLLIENISLYVCIQNLGFHHIWAKCVVSIITILGNYAICKSKIFMKGEMIHG